MVHGTGETWFLAQLKPNSDGIAERNLNQQGFRTFLPREEGTRAQRGKFVTFKRPMFPGYIFVSFDVARARWRSINSTVGVTRLVSFGKEPAPVPHELMSQLFLRCDSTGKLLSAELLNPGDRVRIATGPFAELVAEIESLGADRRVWVLLDVMGAQARVDLGSGQVRRI